ncbi:L-ascorbate metabolism protein UlaG (beta-lactamase superfamily) [Pedobacter cryoconitis]|uniref:L-ascorbate metabolism protein UlaG (Beta-lactamase superfamily) n=1 Tax=Pedobacter cryoconitis TaxID=188932 RepID=A0A7W9DXM1_9SPHI|nr:metal-dependent hydrolase [Pedobacter cryoconitis]MBB5635078.1 L-ascorbate metabolism protein UlaG (beta-lactamase superfamily) [Pedobacter cryoconitis]MBB6271738.1 L-ascorbate metabolism protein UlaG (beta-lactamase superfamily) [Pedobacter cryoconitis]
MKITYYGHSCFAIEAAGKHILFDPFISGNELAKNIKIDEIKADYIFVSHGHFDHILDVTSIANRTGATIVASWELYNYFSNQGIKNVLPINPGGKADFDFGTVKAVVAQHSSSFTDGTYAGMASGFVFKTDHSNFYYSGDTALTLDMTLIPKWANLDFAVFPIGDMLTMGVEDAIEAAQFVQVNKVIGVHYDTFGFIKIDQHEAIQEFKKAGITLQLPLIGQSIEI